MVTFECLLSALYQIQGASDPNDSPDTMAKRMQEIFYLASEQLLAAGYQPD